MVNSGREWDWMDEESDEQSDERTLSIKIWLP